MPLPEPANRVVYLWLPFLRAADMHKSEMKNSLIPQTKYYYLICLQKYTIKSLNQQRRQPPYLRPLRRDRWRCQLQPHPHLDIFGPLRLP